MAKSIAQTKAELAQRETNLEQDLENIAAEKEAIADREEALAKSYTELNAQKTPDYSGATAEYNELTRDKGALYERQVAAHQEAKQIQRQNQLVNSLEQEKDEAEIDALKQEITDSEQEMQRLESQASEDQELTPAQQSAIDAEEQKLEDQTKSLQEKEQESEASQVAAAQQETKNADAVTEACPNKCSATKMTVWPDTKRKVKLVVANGTKVIDVISLSKAGYDKNIIEPPVEEISAFVEGECQKGLTAVSAESSKTSVLQRNNASNHCPVMLVKKDETDIGLPGTQSGPLKFLAFCPDPPGGTFSDWGYVFKNVLMPTRAECKTYIIESKGCEGSYPFSAQIHAYPKIKAGLEVGVVYKFSESESDLPTLNADGTQGEVQSISEEGSGNEKTIKVQVDSWEITVQLKGNVDHINLGEQLQFLKPAEFLKKLRQSVGIFLLMFDIFFMENKSNMGANIYDAAYGGKNVIGDDAEDPIDTTGQVWDRQSSGTTGNIALRYPNLKVAVEYENNEMESSNQLDYKWIVEFKADPLIGVGFELDILSALVKIGMNALLPGSSTALDAGKKFVKYIWPIIEKLTSAEATQGKIEDRKYYVEGGISLIMKLGANLGAGGKFEKEFGQPDGSTSPMTTTSSATAGMDFILEGKVYAKAKALAVEFEAGFIIVLGSATDGKEAKLEFKAELIGDGNNPKVKGSIEWTGLAILFMSYKEFSYDGSNNSGKSANEDEGDGFDYEEPAQESSSITSKATDKKYQNQWVLIEPGKFPEEEEVPFDQYTQL